MEIQFDKKENASALLTITLEQSDYQPSYQSKIKDYSKRVQMKGFRPGKVPPALVERMYGPSLRSEAINSVINSSIDQYLKDNQIELLGDLIADETQIPEEPNENSPLRFSFHMAMRPEFQYPPIETLELIMPEIQVAEGRIEDFIADIRKQQGKMVPAEKISEGDLIKGNLKANDGSFETESSFPFSRIKEGYKAQFLGKAVGETIGFPIEEAFEADEIKYVTGTYKDKERTFSGLFNLEITEITTSEPAEMNQDFFDRAVGKDKAHTEEDFRARIKELFQATYETESEAYFQMAVEKKLFELTDMPLAHDVVTKVIASRNNGKMTEEELADFIPRYLRSMKMSLIKNKVAMDHNIRVSEEDLIQAAKRQISTDFQQMGYGNLGDEFLERYAVTYLNEKDKNNRDRMAESSLADKLAKLVLEKGKIVRKPVSMEEFNRMVEELN